MGAHKTALFLQGHRIMTYSVTSSENSAAVARLYPPSRLVMPCLWHRQLLERYLERADENVVLGRLGCSRLEDGAIEWLIREILRDRSALAAPQRGGQLVAFTRSDGSGPTPWVDSNLPALPQTVVAEFFHGTGAFRGTAWGFHRDLQNGHISLLDELVLPVAACDADRLIWN
jgi:hypothetical protein